ncbi:MFS transporter [Parvularcula oceani]|uniref:MFS transporter n=1 Tax=Parvularcula oceani TaxID=1247963 RepID=UPI00069036CA|nr:MFS transporter [Parvularcula oceani]
MTQAPATNSKAKAVPATRGQRIAVLCASITGSSMAFINGTAVNLAIDPIQAGLNASLAAMLWVASIYMLFLASLMLIGGAVGDFYGRRATFMAGILIFVLASLGCAVAPSATLLIVARAAQGIGAALLTPMSLTLIADFFEARARATAIGIWSAASALFTALGPPIGGWLAENIGWQAIFLMSLPFGAAAFFIALFLVPSRKPPRRPERVDWKGALAAVLGFGGVAYGLITLSERPGFDSMHVWGPPLLVGLIGLGALVKIEQRATSPMAPPQLFGIRTFNAINVITVLLYGSLGGIFIFYPIYLTDAFGHGVDSIGLAFLGFAVPMLVLTAFAGKLTRRFGARAMLTAGSLVGVAAFFSMGLMPYSGTLVGAFCSMMIFGVGIALVVPAMNTALFNVTPDKSHGAASGINNACARAATLFAIAGYGAAASFAFRQEAGPGARAVGYGGGDDLTGLVGRNYRMAIVESFELLTYISIGLTILSAIVAAFFIDRTIEKRRHTSPEEGAAHAGLRRVYGANAEEAVHEEDDDEEAA